MTDSSTDCVGWKVSSCVHAHDSICNESNEANLNTSGAFDESKQEKRTCIHTYLCDIRGNLLHGKLGQNLAIEGDASIDGSHCLTKRQSVEKARLACTRRACVWLGECIWFCLYVGEEGYGVGDVQSPLYKMEEWPSYGEDMR